MSTRDTNSEWVACFLLLPRTARTVPKIVGYLDTHCHQVCHPDILNNPIFYPASELTPYAPVERKQLKGPLDHCRAWHTGN
jgi:hypothetical protein